MSPSRDSCVIWPLRHEGSQRSEGNVGERLLTGAGVKPARSGHNRVGDAVPDNQDHTTLADVRSVWPCYLHNHSTSTGSETLRCRGERSSRCIIVAGTILTLSLYVESDIDTSSAADAEAIRAQLKLGDGAFV